MRLHLLPSVILPMQRTFLATFFFVTLFLVTFFLAFRTAMSIPLRMNQICWLAGQSMVSWASVNKKGQQRQPNCPKKDKAA